MEKAVFALIAHSDLLTQRYSAMFTTIAKAIIGKSKYQEKELLAGHVLRRILISKPWRIPILS